MNILGDVVCFVVIEKQKIISKFVFLLYFLSFLVFKNKCLKLENFEFFKNSDTKTNGHKNIKKLVAQLNKL